MNKYLILCFLLAACGAKDNISSSGMYCNNFSLIDVDLFDAQSDFQFLNSYAFYFKIVNNEEEIKEFDVSIIGRSSGINFVKDLCFSLEGLEERMWIINSVTRINYEDMLKSAQEIELSVVNRTSDTCYVYSGSELSIHTFSFGGARKGGLREALSYIDDYKCDSIK